MPITLVDHPLALHYLSVLRDRHTAPQQFREAAHKLAYALLFEATADLPLRDHSVETPLETITSRRLADEFVAVAVLRAGLGLLGAVLDLLPDVQVGYAGVQRDEATARPQGYYTNLPELRDRHCLVLEPMLATGGSLAWACARMREAGATDITALCVVAAPEGVARMEREHPGVRLIAAACDPSLDANHYIVPGLGDMGDRLFGTP